MVLGCWHIRFVKYVFFFIFLGFLASPLKGQELENLRNERLRQMREIEYTEKLLKQTAASRKDKINQLNILSKQIRSRENVVGNLRGELNFLERKIRNNEKEVELLTKEIGGLKENYARMIYQAYLMNHSYDKVQYILAARDFNQAYKRLKYMQQYGQFRREQAGQIHDKTIQLQIEVNSLDSSRIEQKDLIIKRQQEVAQLNNEKKAQDKTAKELGSKERQLKKDLNDKKKVYEHIEREIQKILEEAMSGAEGSEGVNLTPEMKIVSDDFTQNKGRLPWPIERGVITERYGKHRHAVLKKVNVDNPGVNMTTDRSEPIRAVFKGTVKNIFQVPGANIAIIIQHGEYFTVYQGLVDVVVKKGDQVSIKQNLGRTFAGPNETSSQLHFEVYKGTIRMNPELWLAK